MERSLTCVSETLWSMSYINKTGVKDIMTAKSINKPPTTPAKAVVMQPAYRSQVQTDRTKYRRKAKHSKRYHG